MRDPQPADNLILWLPVFLMCGIGLYFILPFEPVWWGVVVAALSVTVSAVIGWRLRDHAWWRWVVCAAGAGVIGFALIQIHTQRNDVHLLRYSVWNKEMGGIIDSFERVGSGWRVVLSDAAIDGEKGRYNVRLTIRKRGFMPQMGGALRVKGTVMAPSPPMVPHSFDFRRHAFFRAISGYGYATQIVSYTPPASDYRANTLEVYRDWLTEKVYAVLQQPEAGIVTALLNGQRAGIERKSTEILQKSGLQHVISISGLHVSLLAITIFFSVRLLLACSMVLALRLPIKKIAAFCALVGIVFYLLIVGSSPPTLRAVLVTGAALCAVMLDREPIQMRVVALAALAILVLQPDSVVDIGFQMSFAAVIGLVVFYQYTRGFWTHTFWQTTFIHRGVMVLLGTVATSIVATLVTAPLVLYYFQQVPLLSMLANVMASPPITFLIMPGTFLAYMLTPFPVIGDFAIHMMGWGTTTMMDVAHYVAGMPSSVWRTPPMPIIAVIAVMAGMWMVVSIKNRTRFTGLAFVAVGCVVAVMHDMPDLYLTQDRVILYPAQNSDILYVEGRMQKFNRTMMLQWTSKKQVEPFPCDDEICNMTISGKSVRVIRTVEALDNACHGDKADMIVTRYYLDRYRLDPVCRKAVILDRHALRSGGGQAVYLSGRKIRVETARKKHAKRPWY